MPFIQINYEDIYFDPEVPKKFINSEKYLFFMTINEEAKVGKEGEIFPKKHLREFSGFNPGDRVLIEAQPGRLIINKIYSVEELLRMPIISEGSAESVEKDIEDEKKLQEKLTSDEN